MPTDRRFPGGAFLARFLSDRRGATAIEYGLIAAFVCLAIIGSVAATGAGCLVRLGGHRHQDFRRLRSLSRSTLLRVPSGRPDQSPGGFFDSAAIAFKASPRLTVAEPGRAGFGWLASGAQPEAETMSNVARSLPSASAKRSP